MYKSTQDGDERTGSYVSAQQLGPLMGVTGQTIRNWIKKGHIKADRMGSKLRIPVAEAKQVLQHYGLPVPEWFQGRRRIQS